MAPKVASIAALGAGAYVAGSALTTAFAPPLAQGRQQRQPPAQQPQPQQALQLRIQAAQQEATPPLCSLGTAAAGVAAVAVAATVSRKRASRAERRAGRGSGSTVVPVVQGTASSVASSVQPEAVSAPGLAAGSSWQALRAKRALHVQRHIFDSLGLEKLNPFYEAPEEQSRKTYAPIVEQIGALESGLQGKSDDELRAATEALRKRAKAGESEDALLPEAFALVREASVRVLGLRHFDVQLMGAVALHEGKIAEMGTGEGKTLVAILAAFLNALSGKGVHVVTVNDYLARRDAEWVGQPLRFLGLTVGIIQSGMGPEQRRKAYRCDVTYVTNSELGFDYLRDQIGSDGKDLCLREENTFNFAIVDEVDSILIDEARTPLIISGSADQPSSKYQVAREIAKTLKKGLHYTVDEKQKNCVLIEEGVEAAVGLLGKDDLFDPSDPWFPFIVNALNAKELYELNKSYIVKNQEVTIVDEFTGRVMEGRRWSNGLHQAIEAKEGVPIQSESVTLASISYQNLFRLFSKLGGMTGTAFTESKEFEEIYKLKTVVIPPNRPRNREDKDDQVFVDDLGKWKAVARDIENAHRIGRPVLIGTTNVDNSEIVAELLDALDVPYKLLNAKPENVARETEIVASSGRKNAVTIATNMAGRGTDILLGGNSSMMARLKLREELFGRLFPKSETSWIMPDDFYPMDMPKRTRELVQEAVDAAVAVWMSEVKPKAEPKPADEKASADAPDGTPEEEEEQFTELEAEERLSLACEQTPTEDQVLLGLREAFNRLSSEYKAVTDLEKQEVIALGGLYVVGTERHESRRIDNQLRGRCARQGDPGATRFFLSLNDTIFRIFGGDQIKKMLRMVPLTSTDDLPLESGLLSGSLEEAQKKVEGYFYGVRKNLFEYDDVMNTQRSILYGLRRRALLDDDDTIMTTYREFSDRNMEDFVNGHVNPTLPVEEWNLDKLAQNTHLYCQELVGQYQQEDLVKAAAPGSEGGRQAVEDLLKKAAQAALDEKVKYIEGCQPKMTGMVMRQILLMQIDQYWQKHLQNMDFMKSGVSLRAYGQKNPLTEYKLEGYQVFLKMMSRIQRNAVYNFSLFNPLPTQQMSLEQFQALLPQGEVTNLLKSLKEKKLEQGWGERDVEAMREMYRSMGVDIDQLVKDMQENPELPEEQKQVVEFMAEVLQTNAPLPGDEGQAESHTLKIEGAEPPPKPKKGKKRVKKAAVARDAQANTLGERMVSGFVNEGMRLCGATFSMRAAASRASRTARSATETRDGIGPNPATCWPKGYPHYTKEYDEDYDLSKPKESFEKVGELILKELNEEMAEYYQLPEKEAAWVKRSLDYNIRGGKMNRGMTCVQTGYELLKHQGKEVTSLDLNRFAVLGWAVEFLQACMLMADDMMDGSLTRRGQPCWYKLPDVGLLNTNDFLMVEMMVYKVLRRHFGWEPYFPWLIDLVLETTFQTECGQLLDAICVHGDLEDFTPSRVELVAKMKTAFYSFYLPVSLPMLVTGVRDQKAFDIAREVLILMGVYFQAQDDVLDAFVPPEELGKVGTDIQDKKCSWPFAQAYHEVGTAEGKKLLDKSYGKCEAGDDEEKKIKDLYHSLGLQEQFEEYEEDCLKRLEELKEEVEDADLPWSIFAAYIKKIFKRKK